VTDFGGSDALPTGMNQSTTDGSFTVTVKIIPNVQ
jgi:hypothetical protein